MNEQFSKSMQNIIAIYVLLSVYSSVKLINYPSVVYDLLKKLCIDYIDEIFINISSLDTSKEYKTETTHFTEFASEIINNEFKSDLIYDKEW